MKVLLLARNTKGGTRIPDLGLGYLATALRKDGNTVSILQGKDRDLSDIRQALQDFQPELIGLKVLSIEIPSVIQAITLIREQRPSAVLVLGGPHISVAPPEDTMGYFSSVDFAIRGEAEYALPRLTRALAEGQKQFQNIPGLIYRDKGQIKANPVENVQELDEVDYPAWDLIDPRNYNEGWYFWSPEFPRAPILTSRGCPYRCAFCAQNVVGGKRVRRRSLEHVFTEMELLQKTYGVFNFDFVDDNFILKRDYVRQFCEGVLNRGWKIKWNCCGARLDFLDLELVQLMEAAGCNIISIGFESGTQRVLDYMKKDLNIDFARQQTRMIVENTSIRIMGLFILGYPTETEEEIRRTIQWALDLPIFIASFTTFIIFPGCEETERLLATGEIQQISWDHLGPDSHGYAPRGLTLKRLHQLYALAHLRFYGRFHILLAILRYSWTRIPWLINQVFLKLTWHR